MMPRPRKKELGRSDRYPSNYGVREDEMERDDEMEEENRPANKSWSPGDKGQGREGYSKGYGGSGGEGTGPSGPDRKK
jgi:hypothetical protein